MLENLQNIIAHDGKVNLVCIYKETGDIFASTGDDFLINLWTISSKKPKYTLGPLKSKISAMQFGPKSDLLVCGNNEGIVMILNMKDIRIMNQWVVHKGAVTAVCYHKTNQSIVLSGGNDGKLLLLSTQMKKPLQMFNAHKGRINSVEMSNDTRYAVTCGDDRTVRVFDLTQTQMIAKYEIHTGAVTAVAFHPYQSIICSGSKDGMIKFYDFSIGKEIGVDFPIDSSQIDELFFLGEEGVVFTASKDYLKVVGWDPSNCYDIFPLGFDSMNDICILDNRILFVSVSVDRILIDAIRKDSLKYYASNHVSRDKSAVGEIDISKPRTPRLLENLDLVKQDSVSADKTGIPATNLKGRLLDGALAMNGSSNQTKAAEMLPQDLDKNNADGDILMSEISIDSVLALRRSSSKHENVEQLKSVEDSKLYIEYKKDRQQFLSAMNDRHSKLITINEMIDSFGFQSTVEGIAESGSLVVETLNIINLKPDIVTEELTPLIIKICSFAFVGNGDLAVNSIESILQIYGGIFLSAIDNPDDIHYKNATAFVKEIKNLQGAIRVIKNGYTEAASTASNILNTYSSFFK